jgi:hypothetical protein
MPLSASEAISPAMEHAKAQLFRPFRFAQWWRLAFVGLLAGELSSGGCNSNFGGPFRHGSHHSHVPDGVFVPAPMAQHLVLLAALIVAGIVLWFGLVVVFTYISSVMRFVLFDSVVSRECHVRKGWTRRAGIGFRLFQWQLVMIFLTLGALVMLIGIPAMFIWNVGWFSQPRDHILGFVLTGFVVLVLVSLLIVLMVAINVMTKDFVVPQMAIEGIGPVDGWRRLLARVNTEKGGYAGYLAMKFVLAIAAALLFGIITVIVILIPAITVGIAAVVIAKSGVFAQWTWHAWTIAAAIIAGLVALIVLVFIIAMIYVPAIVFFPAYSIYFFAPRYPPLADLLWPSPPAPIPPAPSPQPL